MSCVAYFAKLNLVSGHVFQIYKDETLLNKILDIVSMDLKSDIPYIEEKIVKDGECTFTNSTEYKLRIIKNENHIIYGYIYKSSHVYYKNFNAVTNELESKSVPNTDAIRFYFDVFKETIAFHTSQRFGHREFLYAFSGIINKCMEINQREYRFEMSLRTEGLSFEEITKSLKEINGITELKMKYQPPNPDDETLKLWRESGENFIDSMDEANVTGVSYIFSSKGTKGLNVDSQMIGDSINQIEGIYNFMGNRKAISKGYLSIEATGKNGKKYTTADAKPVKTIIENVDSFFEACVDVIRSLKG